LADGGARAGARRTRLQHRGGSAESARRSAHLRQDGVRQAGNRRGPAARRPDLGRGRTQPPGAHSPAGCGATQASLGHRHTHHTIIAHHTLSIRQIAYPIVYFIVYLSTKNTGCVNGRRR